MAEALGIKHIRLAAIPTSDGSKRLYCEKHQRYIVEQPTHDEELQVVDILDPRTGEHVKACPVCLYAEAMAANIKLDSPLVHRAGCKSAHGCALEGKFKCARCGLHYCKFHMHSLFDETEQDVCNDCHLNPPDGPGPDEQVDNDICGYPHCDTPVNAFCKHCRIYYCLEHMSRKIDNCCVDCETE